MLLSTAVFSAREPSLSTCKVPFLIHSRCVHRPMGLAADGEHIPGPWTHKTGLGGPSAPEHMLV